MDWHPILHAPGLLATLAYAILLTGCGAPSTEAVTLAADAGGELVVEVDFGDGLRPDPGFVRVGAHDRNEVRATVSASGFGAWGVQTRLEADGDARTRLDVRVDGVASWMFGGPRIEVRVLAPQGASLDLRSSGGDLRIDDVEGAVRARVRDAPVEVRGAAGPVKLRSIDGSVRAEEVSGRLEVTGSGDVECAFVRGDVEVRQSEGSIVLRHVDGRVVAKTLDGRIDLDEIGGPIDARTERGPVLATFRDVPAGSIESERGSVETRFASGAGAELDARAEGGDIEIDATLALDGDATRHEAAGRLGPGGALLRIRASNGGIRVGTR